MPLRIYDIAKKLGIESKAVLAKAKELGITTARAPSSTVDRITAEYLEEQLGCKPDMQTAPTPPTEDPDQRRMKTGRTFIPGSTAQPLSSLSLRERLKRLRRNLRIPDESGPPPQIETPVVETISPPTHQPIPATASAPAKPKELVAILGDILILDSNIWMKPEYAPVFRALARFSVTVTMPSVQFDELENKQKRTDERKSEQHKEENSRANLALRRVEELDLFGLLKLEGKPGYSPDKAAFGDPAIIELAQQFAMVGRAVTIVSDDRALRLRARKVIKCNQDNKLKVEEGRSLLAICAPLFDRLSAEGDISLDA